VSFDPTPDFNGPASLLIITNDLGNTGSGVPNIDDDTIDIAVNAVNDALLAVGENYTTRSDQTLTVAAPGLLANDGDADGDSLSVSLVSGPAVGTLVIADDGSFTYRPVLTFNGTVSFSYVVIDSMESSDVVTSTIEVQLPIGPLPSGDLPEERVSRSLSKDVRPETEPGEFPAITLQGPAPTIYETEAAASRYDSQERDTPSVATPYTPVIESNDAPEFVFTTMTDLPKDLSPVIEEVTEVPPEIVDCVDPLAFWDKLDGINAGVHGDNPLQLTAGTVAITSLTMTAGYLFWRTGGGYQLVGLISQLTELRLPEPRPMLVAAVVG
jgi:hypothetical protein